MTRAEQALWAFKEEANFAQAVVSAFAEEFGVDRTAALAAAMGLGS